MISNEEYDIRFCGVYKDCPSCGKRFFVPDTGTWAYKRSIRKGERAHLIYFCKWSCLLKYERKYEEKMKEKKREAAKRLSMQNTKIKHICFDCKHNLINEETGKHYCSLDMSRYVYPKKEACKLFAEKDGDGCE